MQMTKEINELYVMNLNVNALDTINAFSCTFRRILTIDFYHRSMCNRSMSTYHIIRYVNFMYKL